jgi:hypothetical protein
MALLAPAQREARYSGRRDGTVTESEMIHVNKSAFSRQAPDLFFAPLKLKPLILPFASAVLTCSRCCAPSHVEPLLACPFP